MPKTAKYQITKDDEHMAERIKKICILYNIVYNVDTVEYSWYDREKMIYKYGNTMLFSHFILSLFTDDSTLKPIYRTKIIEYATRLGIDNWKRVNMTDSMQIGDKLYSLKSFEEIPADKKFDYLPVYTIEKNINSGEAKKIKKLVESWGQNWDFFIKLVAYGLYQKNLLKVGFILYSKHPNSGKSKFVELLSKILENQNVYASQLEQLCDPKQRFKLAKVHNRLMVSASEFSEKTVIEGGVLKSLLGGDPLEGEIKGAMTTLNVKFNGLLIVSTNYMPTFRNYDVALVGRIHILEFNNSFEPKKDLFVHINDKEYSYVLAEAIEICKEWVKNGIQFDEIGTFTHRIENNSTIMDSFFKLCKYSFEECSDDNKLSIDEIYEHYIEVAPDYDIDTTYDSKLKLGQRLSRKILEIHKNVLKKRDTIYQNGIQFKITNFYGIRKVDNQDRVGHGRTPFSDFPDEKTSSELKYGVLSCPTVSYNNLPSVKKLNSLLTDGSLMEIQNGIYKRVD